MASAKQIAANRRNAQNSTGPKTPEGKQVVSRNALRHGLLATNPVLFPEEQQQYNDLADLLHNERQPQSWLEFALVNRMVDLSWRLLRASQIETGLFITQRKKELEQARHAPANADADAYGDDMEARNRGAQTLSAVFARQSGAFARLNRHEGHLHRLLEKTTERLECLQYANAVGIDPYYASRIQRYPALSNQAKRREEGNFRPQPAKIKFPTVPDWAMAPSESLEREAAFPYEAPLPDKWGQADTAAVEGGFEGAGIRVPVVKEAPVPDELEQAASPSVAAVETGAVEDVPVLDELAQSAAAAAGVPVASLPQDASVEVSVNSFRGEEAAPTNREETNAIAVAAASGDSSPSQTRTPAHTRNRVSAKQSQFRAQPKRRQRVRKVREVKPVSRGSVRREEKDRKGKKP
jgi:hypothetical protein